MKDGKRRVVQDGQTLVRLKGKQLYPLWLVMVGCGLSRSEALALDWEDVTWERVPCIIGIQRLYQKQYAQPSEFETAEKSKKFHERG